MPRNSFVESYYNPDDTSLTTSQLATRRLQEQASEMNSVNNLVNGRSSLNGGARRQQKKRSQRRSRKQQQKKRSQRQSRSQRRLGRQQRGGGRTFDVPMPSDPFQMPGPTFNNAWYTGEACNGPHCGVPVTPFVSEYIHNNLPADTAPGATTQYPVIDRLGNSLGENFPGIQPYEGTELNPGPFNFNCVSGGGRRSRKQQQKKRSQRRSRKQQKKSQRRGRR